ncbi:hypothetical protein K502DRAFT_324549 [Neoconidiobolus thromboides FSU 785]|nr:hypothetical protein K502DRAFT_324549 [Neoconidiobolus thromboides FSU 785]
MIASYLINNVTSSLKSFVHLIINLTVQEIEFDIFNLKNLIMPSTQPIPTSEIKVLETLIMIRSRLSQLKRSASYDMTIITDFYELLNVNVKELFCIREAEDHADINYSNRVDDVIDDVYQLLSLFWMALGKTSESPATYVQLISIEQCLEHLKEFDVYSMDDLIPFEKRIQELEEVIEQETNSTLESNEFDSTILTTLVKRKLSHCKNLLKEFMDNWNSICDELVPIKEKLVDMRKQMAIKVGRGQVDEEFVKQMELELKNINEMGLEDKVNSENGKPIAGQVQVIGLLEECFHELSLIKTSQIEISDNLKPVFEQLVSMKEELSKLYITRRWTMREPDLWPFQVQLSEIITLQKKGKFEDENGKPLKGHIMVHFLLQKCYRIIYKLLASSEPVAESLTPVHSQLFTLRKCLLEVKKYGGPFSARELYPYQIKLASIDNLRQDGKFLDDKNQIPEGQAAVMALLNECYDIMYELKDLVKEL